MAQIMVDSRVMRDKAQTLETSAKSISTIYSEIALPSFAVEEKPGQA